MSDGSTIENDSHKSEEFLDGIPDHIKSKMLEMKLKIDKIEDVVTKMDDTTQMDCLKSTVCMPVYYYFFKFV
jgi:hypothetical protein